MADINENESLVTEQPVQKKSSRRIIACMSLLTMAAAGGIYAQHKWDVANRAAEYFSAGKASVERALITTPEDRIAQFVMQLGEYEAAGLYKEQAVKAINQTRDPEKLDYEAAQRLAGPENFEIKASQYISMIDDARKQYIAVQSIASLPSSQKMGTIESMVNGMTPEERLDVIEAGRAKLSGEYKAKDMERAYGSLQQATQQEMLEKALNSHPDGFAIAVGKIKKDISETGKKLYDKVF
jgi:hypothetical protein